MGKSVVALKDDGCNTNVISKAFVKQNRRLLKIRKTRSVINHSDKARTETSSEIVIGAEVEIGKHKYTSNWVVANSRYDLLLGMPWHTETNPQTDYDSQSVQVGDVVLPRKSIVDPNLTITNIGVKKFRSLLRMKQKKSDDFWVYQLSIAPKHTSNHSSCNYNGDPGKDNDDDPEIKSLKEEFSAVFRDDLPSGLPPERNVDHQVNILPESKPPHRPIFQLSPAELVATKEYVADLPSKEKIRPSKSPF